ncbi:MAG TPA: methyltransferase domain-containing protein [Longimicrobiaceae bacterium]|nr:methyltransferase domain-containing protein [Longimicrobiaceae bacterium]
MPVTPQQNAQEWDRRAGREHLHAVFSTRWSDEECLRVNAEQQALIFSRLPDLAGRSVLDLGCGIGRLTAALAARGARVVGVDVSREMLRRAREEVPSPNVTFLHASAGSLPLPDGSIDVVVASYVFQHLLDDDLFRTAAGEIARVLVPGGLTVLTDGIGERTHRPANSAVTVIRSWEDYAGALETGFELLDRERFLCVEDEYTLTLWRRREDPAATA